MRKILVVFCILSASALFAQELPFINVSGFVDGAYFHDGNANPDSGEFSAFSLDQVEVDLSKQLGERGFVRADIEYLNGADPMNAIDYLEQGYMQYNVPIEEKTLEVMFGKFNAPIGFELLDAPDMYQYSHSEVFTYGLPTNLTGLKGYMSFCERIDAHLYIVNGWDNNSEDNDALTFGGRLGLKPVEKLALGLSAITGGETPGKGPKNRTVIDVDVTANVTEDLLLGGELNIGSESEAAMIGGEVKDASWMGFLAMGHYDFNETFGLTGRLGSFSDDMGIRTGLPSDKDLTYTSITIAPTVSLGEKMGCLLEIRMDSANEEIWLDSDGKATDARTTFAFEVTYGF
ncbi:MAG: outer membrane beta-barrel protein [Calditrichaeota bacterium]|nr:outer membrane beta-barrel protein [Calditrichota bacterium]MCB9391593.1 outer membrane beta-barrel protein [Calditrichota bacterium]